MGRVVIERLSKTHDRNAFDCGVDDLNNFLKTQARKNAEQGVSVTWVAVEERQIANLGYLSITMSHVSYEDANPEITRKLPRYPIPMLHVGRLATDVGVQGKVIGSRLLRHAAELAIDTSLNVGCFGMELVAGDQKAYDFYLNRGFKPVLDNTMRLYMPIAHLKANDVRPKTETS